MNFSIKKSNLNFKVYTVEAKPTVPGAENDIAVISSVPMINWLMSPEAPSGAPRNDGDVWIQYSVSGNTFNALKQNAMMIATIKAWQYVDGVWVYREAVSCQGGVWVDFLPPKVLYSEGKEYIAFNLLDANPTKSGGGFAKEEDCLYIYAKNSAELVGGTAISAEKIDFKNINTVYFTVKAQGGNNDLKIVGLTTGSTGANFDQYTASKFVNSTGEIAVDVSKVNTAQYICMAVASAGQNTFMRISKIRYE